MRWLLDTNVVTSALLWGGTPRLLLDAARDKRVELVTSVPLLAELTNILSRAKFAGKIAASQLTIDQIVDAYASLATVVRPVPVPRIAPDPDDDVVIATALAARADIIVTGDIALLSVDSYHGIKLVKVVQAVDRLSSVRAQ